MTEQEIKALYAESIGSLQLAIEQFEKTLADKPFQSNLKHTVVLGLAPVSYTHLTLPTILLV